MRQIEWFDNHCHLPADIDSAREAVSVANAAGVTKMIDVGTDVDRSQESIARAAVFDCVWATVGLHPHDASSGLDGIAELVGEDRVVAIGECGLDYHYDYSPRSAQRQMFAEQIRLAHEHDLPLVIHSRSAWDDTFDVLQGESMPTKTVFHCFTGGPAEAERGLELGALLSFSGIITFKSAADLRAAAEICPLERLMIETDSPYLTPEPHRGQPNRPALVTLVGQKVAEVKATTVGEVARVTTANAAGFYGV